MLRGLLPALAAVASLAVPAPGAARAQTPTRETPFPLLPDARRWGPFMVDVGLTLENFGYDDNIYLATTSSGLPKEGDWVLRLAPEIKAQTTFGKNVALTVRDKATGEVFATNSNLNHLDNEAEAQFDLLAGPLLLTSRARYATAEWRPNSELRNRVEQRDALLGQSARLFFGSRTDVVGDYSVSEFRYDDPGTLYAVDDDFDGTLEYVPIEVVLDRRQTRVRGEVGWRATSATRMFLRAEKTDADFEERTRDSEDRRVLFGFEFSPSSRLSGRLVAGLARLKEKDEARGLEPYEGPVAQTELIYRPTGASRVRLRWDRQLYFSTFENNLYYVSILKGLSVDWYFGSAWGVQAGYSLENADYPETGILPGEIGIRRSDEITDGYAGVLYRTRGGVEIGLRYGQRLRESNYPGIDDEQRYLTTTGRYAF